MSAGRTGGRPASGGATFELERFTWGAPDRLELEGRFAGLDRLPADPPVLVVRGAERTQRLPAVAGGDGGADGRWQAAFAWLEAPAAFDGARLELGDAIAVDLPGPRARRRPFHREVLEVHMPEAAPAADAGATVGDAERNGAPSAAERLQLQTDLLAAREEARELQGALQRATDELVRTREDLEAARAEHVADSERFRDGLASVRETAEEALATERTTAEAARSELEATVAAQATELEELRERLQAAEEARAAAETEASDLRERASAATPVQEDLIAAHDEAERLVARLSAVRDALGSGG
jgi:hypothetical protein